MTSLELKVQQALNELGYRQGDGPGCFVPQFRAGKYRIDFALVANHIAIEVDGKIWHGGSKDKQKDNFLSKIGWKIIRLSELAIGSKNLTAYLRNEITIRLEL